MSNAVPVAEWILDVVEAHVASLNRELLAAGLPSLTRDMWIHWHLEETAFAIVAERPDLAHLIESGSAAEFERWQQE